MAKKKTTEEPTITASTLGAQETATKGILNVSGVAIAELHPEGETVSTDGPKAVDGLNRAVGAASGVLGDSEILAVVNRRLVDLQGERDVLV